MFAFLQTFNRVILAFLSGALLIIGTAFWADFLLHILGESGGAFDEIIKMLRDTELRTIFIVITGLTAYAIGIINFAASSVAFSRLVKATQEEVILVSRIESLQQPQVLKEIIELLYIKRTLVAFAFPLFYFGLGLAFDLKEKWFTHIGRIAVGGVLTVIAVLAPLFAVGLTRLLDTTAKRLLDVAQQADVPERAPGDANR